MKLLSKSALLTLLLASFAISAQAQSFNLGSFTAPATVTYGHSFGASLSNFQDDFTFSIAPQSALDSITSTINLSNVLGISNLSASLYQGGNLLAQSSNISTTIFPGLTDISAVINPINVAAGSYTLEITGNVIGTSGGSYSGVLNAAPVPEPGEWSMLLSGISLLGFIAYRSRQA